MMARSTARRAQAPHFEVNIFTDDAHKLSPKFVDNVLIVSGAAPGADMGPSWANAVFSAAFTT